MGMSGGFHTILRTGSEFPATRWSLVVSAKETDGTAGQRALDEFCRLYWRPVYAYIRRRGKSPADSEDLTQSFFAALLGRESLVAVTEEKGKLRSFLLTAVSRHMASEHERATALKRGGGARLLPLDCGLAERGLVPDPGHSITPDLEFERQWALGLLLDALNATREDYQQAGNGELFEALKGQISLDAATDTFAAIGDRLGMSEGAVKVAAHRMRGRFRDHLRKRVAETVGDDSEIDGEIRHLFGVFQRPG